jgi:5'-nucleotidase
MRTSRKALAGIGLATWLIAAGCGETKPRDFRFQVFHQNDRHSHWLGQPNLAYRGQVGDGTLGGLGRWGKLVQDARAAEPDSLLLDSGDFKMGTLLAAARGGAGDLELMAAAGVDAAVIGNHELDWGPAGLAAVIQAAQSPGVPLLATNMRFDPTDPADDALAALHGPAGQAGKRIHPHLVLELPSGVRVGLLGLLGPESWSTVPQAAPVTFQRSIAQLAPIAQAAIDELRQGEGVDAVILLAHMGLELDGGQVGGDTAALVAAVRGLDLVLSGHNHTASPELHALTGADGAPVWAMEAGKYGSLLSRITLERQGSTRSAQGELIAIDDSLPADASLDALVTPLIQDVEQNFLASFSGGCLSGEFFQALTTSSFPLARVAHDGNNLANLVADAMRQVAGTQVAAVSNGGDVRDDLLLGSGGEVNLADAFIVTPLGIGPDGRMGYPLVHFYLTWGELKLILEATTASGGLGNNDFFMQLSGLRLEFDSSQPEYMRVRRLELCPDLEEAGPCEPIFDAAANPDWRVDPMVDLVHLTTSSYIGAFLSSYNLQPRNAQGLAGEFVLVRDAQDREVKLWSAVACYLAGMTPGVPLRYHPDPALNPVGPPWRRVWDLARHPR